MKFKSLLLTVLIVFSIQSFGQDVLALYRAKSGRWGFMNMKGEVVVEAKYTTICKPFRSGMARIDKTHFINLEGERIYPKHRVIEAREYNDGVVAIKTTKGWGFMNRKGELVTTDTYKYVTDFNNGYAAVKKKEGYFIIDKMGSEVKVVNSKKKKIAFIKRFSDSLAPIEIGGHWGYVNEKGEIAIGTIFLGVGYFEGGIAWARGVNEKVGFIDKKGDWIIEPIFYSARNFDLVSGLSRVKGKDGLGYLTIDGIFKQFDNSRDHQRFYDGMCRETEKMGNSKSGYLNAKGEWELKPIYGITGHFHKGFANVRVKGKWGIINKKGEYVVEPKYSFIERPHSPEE